MKRFVAALTLTAFLGVVSGCGDTKVIDGVEYDTYGLLNEDTKKNPNIQYELIVGNLVWGILLVETLFAPVYFFGFSLFEPVGKKPPHKGEVTK